MSDQGAQGRVSPLRIAVIALAALYAVASLYMIFETRGRVQKLEKANPVPANLPRNCTPHNRRLKHWVVR